MFGKRVIRLGDSTTHGGTVIATGLTLDFFNLHGQPVARVGDTCSCPIPGHGNCTIIEGIRTGGLMAQRLLWKATTPAAAQR